MFAVSVCALGFVSVSLLAPCFLLFCSPSLSLSIWWGINIHLTSQLNATRILKPGNADPNDNIMIYRQQTLLKSCRDATLGRDNTLAPDATPLPRISPALTQKRIDYDDTLDPLGIYTCLCVCFLVFACIRMSIRMRMCMHMHMNIQMRTCMCVNECKGVLTYVYMYVYACMYECTYGCMSECMNVCV